MRKRWKGPPGHIGALLVLSCLLASSPAWSQQTLGLFVNDDPQEGLTLFAPAPSTNTYLINNDGLLVNSWTSAFTPGIMAYLLDNGDLLRAVRLMDGVDPRWSTTPAHGGGLEQHDWDGNLVWEFDYVNVTEFPHHDIEPLPNGNVLLVVWDVLFEADAIALGMNPAFVNDEVWIDKVIEVEPTPPIGGNIVWEWHAKDHLIQDFDGTKPNHGVVADHPELVDINYGGVQLDWSHINGIDYNPAFDQIILSNHTYHELWIIDHSTTTAEAAGHTGGNSGKGGDLLYRWGNPQVYDRGTPGDQMFFGQHDTQWIVPGRPGAGNILVFNNGRNRPGGNASTVDEIVPPVDVNGNYSIGAGVAYGPAGPSWTYEADPPTSWFSAGRSGAERMANGNTLICQATGGRFFEVEPDGTIVWEYVNPAKSGGGVAQGEPATGNGVFKVRRYPLDFPGFAGRDLTPGDPVELFTRPFPVPDDSLRVSRDDEDRIEVEWDAFACSSLNYKLVYGGLENVATWTLDGAECAIGAFGFHPWVSIPDGDLFLMVLGTADSEIYESSWGATSGGAERFGTKASFLCGTTTKVVTSTCP